MKESVEILSQVHYPFWEKDNGIRFQYISPRILSIPYLDELLQLNHTKRMRLLIKTRTPSTIVWTITVSSYDSPHLIIDSLEIHTISEPGLVDAPSLRFALAVKENAILSLFTVVDSLEDWLGFAEIPFFPLLVAPFFNASFLGAIVQSGR